MEKNNDNHQAASLMNLLRGSNACEFLSIKTEINGRVRRSLLSSFTKNRACKGFTLIEVLVAVVILAGGLLGLAAVQSTALSNNLSAYNRSQATQLAYDIADKMRSNPTAAAKYLVALPVSCPNGLTSGVCSSCTSPTTACSPDTLAQKDLYEWNRDLNAALPNGGIGSIELKNGIYTVTISWSDDKNSDESRSFTMNFRL